MEFQYVKIDTWPRLAWCAELEISKEVILVFHGNAVETYPQFFVEGAWDGNFTSSSFIESTIFSGTGSGLYKDKVCFSSSTDRLCPIFSIVKNGTIFISNSPVCVMSVAHERPDDIYPFYNYDFIRIWRKGLSCQDGKLKLESKNKLHIHFSTIMSIDQTGSIRFGMHPLSSAFTDFTTYRDLLLKGVRGLLENAGDSGRKHNYTSIAGISKGYDTCATASLASQSGCKEAITFTDSRKSDDCLDSGDENAAYLGMSCVKYDRWTYLEGDGRPEVETGIFAFGSSIPMASLNELLVDKILITGNFGDSIWDIERSLVCDGFSQTWTTFLSGVSPIELRLRVGYLIFSPATIGARHNRLIHRIAISDEMRSWSLGGNYDRPLPRRIAEEAGIPREKFGRVKMASSHSSLLNERNFSDVALRRYLSSTQSRHARSSRTIYYYWLVLVNLQIRLFKVLDLIRGKRIVAPSRLNQSFPFIMNKAPANLPWTYRFIFQWVFDSLRERYRLPDR